MDQSLRTSIKSRGLLFYKITNFLVGAFILLTTVIGHSIDQEHFWVGLGIAFLLLYSVYLLMNAKRVEFDNEFVYLKTKSSEEKISFKDISAIRWWSVDSEFDLPILSKIEYTNTQNKKTSSSFFMGDNYKNEVEILFQKVREKNPDANLNHRWI